MKIKMKKLLEIDGCDDCTNYDISSSTGVKGICELQNKYIPDDDTDFPKWCPLENAEDV